MSKVAVLFLVFNRPEVTAKCFEAIRAARPERLYVAADGPRQGKENEAERCELARRLATAVDWSCDVQTLFRSENLGCRRAVSGAIDWFFSMETEGIILEDDCLASPSWFSFAEEMLDRYRDDERIMCISASHFHGEAHKPEHSYFFSRYNHCWGWASWRRAWAMYDVDMSGWPALRGTSWLTGIGRGSRLFTNYWRHIFDRAHAGLVDSWAYRWTFSCWAQSGLTIMPSQKLVINIGFDSEATHTFGQSPAWVRPIGALEFPLQHPVRVTVDEAADLWTDRNVFYITPRAWLQKFVPEPLLACARFLRRLLRSGRG